jgi:hypothetical protein
MLLRILFNQPMGQPLEPKPQDEPLSQKPPGERESAPRGLPNSQQVLLPPATGNRTVEDREFEFNFLNTCYF